MRLPHDSMAGILAAGLFLAVALTLLLRTLQAG